MQDKLIIFLHAHAPDSPDWVVINQDGMCSDQVIRGESVRLAGIANDKQVFVIVPSEPVLVTSVILPKMNRVRLQKALPYALEEQLIDDIDLLHFANGDYQAGGELPVAIVSHEKMQLWTRLVNEWNVKPDAMIPLALAVPFEHDVIHIVVDQVANVRTGLFHGFACDVGNLLPCFNLAMASSGQMPSRIKIHNTTGHPCASEFKVAANVEEELISPNDLLALIAKTLVTTPYLNLLQDQYRAKKARLPGVERMVKTVTGLSASCLLLLFLYPMVSYLILSSRLHDVNNEITAIYQQHFPNTSSMVAPKTRMDEKLHKLEGDLGQNRFLLLLGYVGKGLANTDNVKLKRLDFQNGQLTLEISAASSDDFDSFTKFLTSQGLEVKQQNATLSGSRVNATLQVG